MRLIALALLCVFSTTASAGPRAGLATSVVVAPGISRTVLNLSAIADSNSNAQLLSLNLAHALAVTSTQVGYASQLTSDGYPTSGITGGLGVGNNLSFIPNYYGHYKLWWTNTGAFEFQGESMIIYAGATSVSSVSGGMVTGNPMIGFNSATTQPTSAAPIEYSFGSIVTAVSNGSGCTGGTAGLVCLTGASSNSFGGISTGQVLKVNFVNNLTSGPWTVTVLDTQHIQLQGSTYSGTMSVNGGSPGAASEVIFNHTGSSWNFPAQGFIGANYSGMGGMVICRSQNVGYLGNDDCTNLKNGGAGSLANPDYISLLSSINPYFVRTMTQTGVLSGIYTTSFAYRTQPSNLTWWNSGQFTKDNFAGLITNVSDTLTTASNPVSSPASGPPVDGEVVTGYMSAGTTTTRPKLIVNRTGYGSAVPIVGPNGSLWSLTMSGSVPPTGTTISLVFSGGALSSPFTYTYVTSTTVTGPGGALDTSFTNIATNIIHDINFNNRGNSGTLNAKNIVAENPQIANAQITFGYNPNINSSGAAVLGNGMTISGSDSASSATYNFGFLNAGFFSANDNGLFVFSAVAGGWLPVNGGPNAVGQANGPPLELYEDLAVSANVGLWHNISMLYSDTAIYSTVLHMGNAGVPHLALEFMNEGWNNSGGGSWQELHMMGQLYGLQSAFVGGPSEQGYLGLRTIQMAIQARAAWAAAGRDQNDLYIVGAYQFVALNGSSGLFNGSGLNPASNVTLAAYGGSPSNGTTTPGSLATNYNAFPNRPVDWEDFIAMAPYFDGRQFNAQFENGLNESLGLSFYNCALVAAYNWVNGNPTEQAASLNFMFNGTSGDFYTTTPTFDGSYTMAAWAHGSGVAGVADYFGAAGFVAGYDAQRTGTNPHTGIAWRPLGVAGYEGGEEASPTTQSGINNLQGSLFDMGDTSGYTSGLGTQCGMTPHVGGPTSTLANDAINYAQLLLGFKNSANYKALYLQYFNDFKTMANSQGSRMSFPGVFEFEGSNILVGSSIYGGTWAQMPGSIYTTPFKSVDAMQQFN